MHRSDGLSPPSHRRKAVEAHLPDLACGTPSRNDALDAREVLQWPITTLAYVGDAWYEWELRLALLRKYRKSSGRLSQAAAFFSSAPFQAYLYACLEARCTATEAALLRRARNYKSRSVPKHGDIGAYRMATAVEAVLGYLLLSGQKVRAEELLHHGWRTAAAAWSSEDGQFRKKEG